MPLVNQKFQRTPRRLKLGRINLNRKQKKKIRVNNISFEGNPKEDLNSKSRRRKSKCGLQNN